MGAIMSHICPWWFAYTFDNPLRKIFHQPKTLFASHVFPGMSAADIGCGMGYFTIGLAKMVGKAGTVYAVDIQEKMLRTVRKRAQKKNLSDIIRTRLVNSKEMTLPEPVDFALAFWMVHEVPDIHRLMKQINRMLKPDGLFVIAEPKFHVSMKQFNREISIAKANCLEAMATPEISLSVSAILRKQKER